LALDADWHPFVVGLDIQTGLGWQRVVEGLDLSIIRVVQPSVTRLHGVDVQPVLAAEDCGSFSSARVKGDQTAALGTGTQSPGHGAHDIGLRRGFDVAVATQHPNHVVALLHGLGQVAAIGLGF
jgi:hypothetical protein